jgi:hypothetical protein
MRRSQPVLEQVLDAAAGGERQVRTEAALPPDALQGIRLEGSSLVIAARLVDGRGRRSAPSPRTLLSPEPDPDPPDGLTATAEEEGIALAWHPPPSGPPVVYHLYRREGDASWPFRPILEVPGEQTAVLDETARYGTTYTYALRAAPRSGRPYIESESVLAPSLQYLDVFPPAVPEEVRVLETPEGLRVVWFWGPGSPATLYRVQRAVEDGSFTQVAEVSHPGSDWTDGAAVPGRRYRYRVVAEDDRGNRSVPSVTVEGRRVVREVP